MNEFVAALKKYAVFSGRARRREFWLFLLFTLLIGVALVAIDGLTGTYNKDAGLGLLSGVWALGTFIPYLAVGVRRFHDTGRSGWWWLISLVPLVGSIVLLVFFVKDSEPGSNRYGPNPKGIEAGSTAA